MSALKIWKRWIIKKKYPTAKHSTKCLIQQLIAHLLIKPPWALGQGTFTVGVLEKAGFSHALCVCHGVLMCVCVLPGCASLSVYLFGLYFGSICLILTCLNLVYQQNVHLICYLACKSLFCLEYVWKLSQQIVIFYVSEIMGFANYNLLGVCLKAYNKFYYERSLGLLTTISYCRSCGRVKLPHFYCCSGDRGSNQRNNSTSC